MGESIEEIAVGVLRQPLQRHGAAGGIADQALQLIAPVRGDRGVSVERKPVDAGAARPSEPWCLALGTKPCANTAYVLPGPFSEGDTVLHGGRHGTGKLRGGV